MITLIESQRSKACQCGKRTPLRLVHRVQIASDPAVELVRSSDIAVCPLCAKKLAAVLGPLPPEGKVAA